MPPSAPAPFVRELQRAFQVEPIRTTVLDSEIAGALTAANSHGILVGDHLDDEERAALEKAAPVTEFTTRLNALGNNVLANDHGAIVHPEFSDEMVRRIGAALHVPAVRGTVAGLGTVGMAAVATNRGAVVHPKATESEVAELESVLKVPVHRSTANFGVPIVGACLVANSRYLLVGRPTTPVEILHLEEGLGLIGGPTP